VGEDVILGAALALPSYLSYEAFHSLTKHRFLCNLTRGQGVLAGRLAGHEMMPASSLIHGAPSLTLTSQDREAK